MPPKRSRDCAGRVEKNIPIGTLCQGSWQEETQKRGGVARVQGKGRVMQKEPGDRLSQARCLVGFRRAMHLGPRNNRKSLEDFSVRA